MPDDIALLSRISVKFSKSKNGWLIADAYDGKRQVARLFYMLDRRKKCIIAENILVLPEYRRRGVASALYFAVEEKHGRPFGTTIGRMTRMGVGFRQHRRHGREDV